MKQTRDHVLSNKKDEERRFAMDEIMALKNRYEGDFYSFQYGGEILIVKFISACLQSTERPASGYQIQLLASPQTLVDGPCSIMDTQGRKISAFAATTRGKDENSISIEAIAFKSTDSFVKV